MPKTSANKNEIAKAVIAIVLSVQIMHKPHPIILMRDFINDMRKCFALVDSFSSGIYCLFSFFTNDLSRVFCFFNFAIVKRDSRYRFCTSLNSRES